MTSTDTIKINSYREVYEVLNQLSEKDKNKLPRNLILNLKNKMNENYEFYFDVNKPLESQNISYKAQLMLAVIFRDYLASEKQKNMILTYEKAQRKKMDEEAREKYNPDKIFENNNDNITHGEIESVPVNNENSLIAVSEKENLISKIIRKIKNILKSRF